MVMNRTKSVWLEWVKDGLRYRCLFPSGGHAYAFMSLAPEGCKFGSMVTT